MIRNWYADFISIEHPFVRAFQANLVVPIPETASRISGLGIVGVGEDAFSVLEVISLEASKAGS